MSSIIINGVSYHECFHCGSWGNGIFCKCRDESKSKAILKILETFRKRYNFQIFITPYNNNQQGFKKHMDLHSSVFNQNVPRACRVWEEVRPADFYSQFLNNKNNIQ